MNSLYNPNQVKFFLGFLENGEIKMHLNQSPLWKEANLFHNQELIKTQFEGKEYIGISISSPLSSLQLKEKEKDLKGQLQYYCPKLQVDKHHIYIFPQLFLS